VAGAVAVRNISSALVADNVRAAVQPLARGRLPSRAVVVVCVV